jgi:CubicO group peptidase (beta-lactamase class C family)
MPPSFCGQKPACIARRGTKLGRLVAERFEAVCEAARAAIERVRVPGAAVGMTHEGEEEVAGFGVTNVEHPLSVDEDTLFQIGSITKTFTGTAVMRLVESGDLDLDEPVRTYLPELRLADEEVAQRVTTRHLLTHTGGWEGDYFDDLGPGDDALARMVAAVAELPQVTPLSQIWSYNNAGFYIAGRVVEVVSGKGFEPAIGELVLEPLGLTRSFFFADDVITHRFAVGHFIEGEEASVARPWPVGRAAHPAGGLVCSPKDLLRYARFHMGDGATADGTRLLSPESMASMRTPHAAATGRDEIGLTWFLRPIGRETALVHGGGTNGQASFLVIVPSREFAVVAFANALPGAGEVIREMTRPALAGYLGLEEPDPQPIDLSPDDLAEYAGLFSSAMVDVEIRIEDGRLVEHDTPRGGFPRKDSPPQPAPPPSPLAFYEPDRVFVTEGMLKGVRSEFLRDSDGRVAWYRAAGRVLRRTA